MSEVKLGDVSFITKLAGFEHTKYIQGNNTHDKISEDDVPLFIGKTVQNGKIDRNFDWYIPKQISDQLERSKLNKKCLVLPYVGSVGDLAIFDATYDAHLGSNIAKIELACNSGYSEEFIYYFLKSDYGQKVLLRDIQGAIQKNITMKAIRDVSLPDISIQEQDKIVSILKSLDDKIDNNNQINQELEVMAKTLYDYWFVQFDFPDQNGKPYKSSGGKMVCHPELKREIPEGWGVEKLGELAQFKNDINYEKTSSGSEKVKIINVRNISSSTIFINQTDLDEIFLESDKSTNFIVNEGMILITRSGIPGATRLVSGLETKTVYSGFIIASEVNDLIYKNLIFYYLKNVEEVLKNQSAGTIMKNISQSVLTDMAVSLPPQNLLLKFNSIIDNLFEQMKNVQRQNQELTQLRDWLLPLLMNGQVKVE